MQLLRTLHINQKSDMIFVYVIKIVEFNERNSMLQHSSNIDVNALSYWNVKFWSHTNWWIQNSIIQTSTTTSTSTSYQLKHENFNEFQQIMQLTLNLDLSTTTRSRDAATRHAKEREKRRALQKLTSTSTSTSTSASIEINALYEYHSMTVTSQTSVEFRESHYTINDRNEMKLNKQTSEIYSIIQSTIIQNSVTRARLMFDVTFDASKIEKHTRSQVKSQQKLLQKNQEAWENQIFQYWWQLKRAEIIRINEKLSWNLEYRLKLSEDALFQEHCRSQSWTERSVWSDYAHCKFKKYYSSFSTTVRINDEKRIRLHMREKIIRHNSRFLLKSLTKYVCNAMQRKRWKLNSSHNISIAEKAQFAKNIKRAKKMKETMNAKTTRIKREKNSTWSDESNDFDESNDTYMTDESIDSDKCFENDDERVQWSELIELRIEADEHKWKQKRELYSSLSWSI